MREPQIPLPTAKQSARFRLREVQEESTSVLFDLGSYQVDKKRKTGFESCCSQSADLIAHLYCQLRILAGINDHFDRRAYLPNNLNIDKHWSANDMDAIIVEITGIQHLCLGFSF